MINAGRILAKAKGFTRSDLVALVALTWIIALLIAILLPALQEAREKACLVREDETL